MSLQRSPRPQNGFSLVEVMVAVAVIAVGLLGVAKMEALSLASTGSASMRSLAAIEAASFAASMHADRDYWAGGAQTTTVTTAGGTAVTATDGALQADAAANPDCLQGGGAPCSNTQLAAYDLDAWGAALAQLLPSATATISCPTLTAPRSCTIQITWQENAVGINSQETSAAQANATNAADANQAAAFQIPTYTLYVEP
ncbi:MAG: type IV pilus modification protein PilV [Steroidobacteraceae bacterium]